MQRFARVLTLSSGLACAALMLGAPRAWAEPTTPPAAADVALSERYAARAFDAYKRKDYQSAIALYQKALEAAPSADILYNIARIYDMGLRDRALALSFYGRYVDDPGAIPNRIEVANKRIAELRAAELAAVAPAPAQPAAPTAVVPPQPPPVAAAAPVHESSSGLTTTAIVAGSVGLVGIGLGVGFGLAAQSDLDESDRYCNGNECTSQLGVDAAKDANREANIATIGFAAGGSLLALGAVLWFVSSSSSEHPELAPELAWTPRIGPNELSLAFSGSFGAP